MFDINKFASDLANYVANGVLTKENAEAVYEAACIKYDINPDTGEANVPVEESSNEQSLSGLDLINQFIEERIQEAADSAPAEANPATHVEDEIDEKLPVENPNEPTPIGCTEDIEKTDKAIEDAKKYLDVAAKLAEMKSAHEAEKDTTQQHEVIKQALESTEDQIKLTKLNIYESADAGIITEEEKKELLDILNVIDD